MDDLTAILVAKLQLEDIDELTDRSKNKQGCLTDADHALIAYKEELQELETFISDRRLGRSISEAVQSDGEYITAARVEEQNALRDRHLACALGGVRDSQKDAADKLAYVDVDEELLRRLSLLNDSQNPFSLSEESHIAGEPSTSESVLSHTTASEIPRRQCVACQERKHTFDVLEAPCHHIYCRDCVSDLFQTSTTDESLFPPRCCRQNIPLTLASDFLTSQFMDRFEEKEIEFTTLDRTYCAQSTCSAFIPSHRIDGDRASCPMCHQDTCTICKGLSHDEDCPNDRALQNLLATAAEAGWRRCYACRRFVELEQGCNHMTYDQVAIESLSKVLANQRPSCLCRAEFCYVCGERWKTCDCLLWNEERLHARGAQIVQRDNQPGNAEVQQRRVEHAVQNLRERHECEHQRWIYVCGPHICEECHHTLPQYIFECRQCRLQACNRCRRNRL